MTGSFHEFVLMPAVSRKTEWQEQVGVEHPQRISDDVVHFMMNSLKWVETKNPAQENAGGRGLNLYGPTRIEGDSAALLAKILRAWVSLFQCGPPSLELEVAALAEEASREGQWLLHLGV